MSSPTMNTQRRSEHFVLTVTFVFATVLLAAQTANAQQLQQGVSVQLAVTSNATPMPEADNQDAWIVAITADGSMYWGIAPLSPSNLYYNMKSHLYYAQKNRPPPNRKQKLFIKADARASFANVEKVLDAARALDLDAPVLLTSQPGSVAPGVLVPPKGLEVLYSKAWSAVHSVVQVLSSEQLAPKLKLNNADISEDALQSLLQKLPENRSEEWVVVIVAGTVPFAQVAHVIDMCRGTGAQVLLAAPEVL